MSENELVKLDDKDKEIEKKNDEDLSIDLEVLGIKDESKAIINYETSTSVDTSKLENDSTSIINKIIEEQDANKLQDYTNLFKIAQQKKNIVRVSQLSNLVDIINDLATRRLIKHPNEITTKELLDYMMATQNSLEKSQKLLDNVGETPLVQLNNQTNNVNVNVDSYGLDRDSRERVIEAVSQILNGAVNNNESQCIDIPDTIEEGNEDE